MDLYETYHDRFIWQAAPGVVVILIAVLFGLFGNANIFIATVRKNKSRKPVHILIGATALFDVLHQVSHVVFAFNFFRAHIFFQVRHCFLIQCVSMSAMNYGSFAYLALGLDRLFCVLQPLTYQSMRKTYYTAGMLAAPALYAALFLAQAGSQLAAHGDEVDICFITTPFRGGLGAVWNVVQWSVFALTIACYALVWRVFRGKKESYDRRISRTLSYIVSGIIFGWFITTIVNTAFQTLGADSFTMFLVHTDFGWPANVAIAANYVIYYLTYPDYRRAFREQLGMLGVRPAFLDTKTRVQPSSMQKAMSMGL